MPRVTVDPIRPSERTAVPLDGIDGDIVEGSPITLHDDAGASLPGRVVAVDRGRGVATVEADRPDQPRRLVIDDNRIMTFDAHYARTSSQAIDALDHHGPWDEVWFDHDLAGTDTVIPVLLWLLERHAWDMDVPTIGRCVVHTTNPEGGQRLVEDLSFHYPTVRVAVAAHVAAILDDGHTDLPGGGEEERR